MQSLRGRIRIEQPKITLPHPGYVPLQWFPCHSTQAAIGTVRNNQKCGVQYRNPWNRVRVGRVLEDMDSMAGYIAFLHCDDSDPSKLPPLLVTAAVERIEILHDVDLDRDATLCAILCIKYVCADLLRGVLTIMPSPVDGMEGAELTASVHSVPS